MVVAVHHYARIGFYKRPFDPIPELRKEIIKVNDSCYAQEVECIAQEMKKNIDTGILSLDELERTIIEKYKAIEISKKDPFYLNFY